MSQGPGRSSSCRRGATQAQSAPAQRGDTPQWPEPGSTCPSWPCRRGLGRRLIIVILLEVEVARQSTAFLAVGALKNERAHSLQVHDLELVAGQLTAEFGQESIRWKLPGLWAQMVPAVAPAPAWATRPLPQLERAACWQLRAPSPAGPYKPSRQTATGQTGGALAFPHSWGP